MIRPATLIGFFLVLISPFLLTEPSSAQATYTLKPTPKTVAWGYYDAKAALRVKSSETEEIQAPVVAETAQDEKHPIIYVKHLEPPYYPPLAHQTRVHGTVVMKLKIGADGKILGIESEPMDSPKAAFAMLKDHAEKNIKTWTFGCVGCPPDASFEQVIKFTYILDNNLPEHSSRTTMDLPDVVTMSTGPIFVNPATTSKKENH